VAGLKLDEIARFFPKISRRYVVVIRMSPFEMKEPKIGAGTLEPASEMDDEAKEVTFLLRILPYVGPRILEADRIGGPRARDGTVASLERLLWPLEVPGGAGSPSVTMASMMEVEPAQRKRGIRQGIF
jgi:hypothetical protein